MVNRFLDLVDDESATPESGGEVPAVSAPVQENRFLDLVDNEEEQANTQLRNSVYTTDNIAPDAAAKQYKLSKDTGLPIDTVRNKQADIEKQAKFNAYNFDAIQKDTPDFAEKLRNPALAPIIKDDVKLQEIEKQMQGGIDAFAEYSDVEKMGYFERIGADAAQSWNKLWDSYDKSGLDNKRIANDYGIGEPLNALDERELAIINNRPNVNYKLIGASQIVGATIDSVGSMLKPFQRGAQSGVIGAGIGAVQGAAVTAETGPGALVGAAAGAARGFSTAFSSGMTAGIFEQNLGSDYTTFKDLTDKDGVPMDRDTAMGAALLTSTLNTGLERVALDRVLEQFPGMNKLLGDASKSKIKELLVSGEGRELFRSVGAKLGKAVSVGGLAEAATEWLQNGNSILGAEAAKYVDGGNYDILGMPAINSYPEGTTEEEIKTSRASGFEKFIKGSKETMDYSAERAFWGGVGASGVGSLSTSFVEHVQAKHSAEVEQNVIGQQLDQVRESTTHQINPEIFNEVTTDTLGKQDIYISAEKLQAYFQSGKGDYEEFSKLVPEAAEQMQEALERGGDLILPANKLYSAVVANDELTGLQADMRLTPESVTAQDAQDIYDGQVIPEYDVLPENIAEFAREDEFRNEVESKLLAAGESTQSARESSAIVAAQYKNLLRENANNPVAAKRIQKWADNLRIKGAPEIATQEKERIENIDLGIDKLRARATAKSKKGGKAPKPLLAKLRKLGVKQDSSLAGELRNIGIKEKGSGVGLFRKNGGVGEVDNWTASEFEAEFGISNVPTDGNGYVDSGFILDLLAREQAGEKLSDADIQAEAEQAALDDLERELGGLGVDVKTATNEEIKAALKARDEEKRYNQSNPQTETEAFKKWFGDSKVVGENGDPLVVYHGTEKGGFESFDEYEIGKNTNASEGFYFTENKLNASTYSGAFKDKEIIVDQEAFDEGDAEAGTYSVYLSLQNPLIVDFEGRNWDGADQDGDYDPDVMGMNDYAAMAQDRGYDGVIAKNVSDEGGHGRGYNWGEYTYIAFKPEQIKSATQNQGTFDSNNPNILHQENRGQIGFNTPTQDALIKLFANKDTSTFMHEAGHYFLEMMKDVSSVSVDKRTLQRWEDTKKWLGVEGDAQLTVDQHEKFADGFLRYLEKGEAPSVALIESFRAFRAWLSNLWRQFRNLKPQIKVTKDVQDLFDRMLASDEEIELIRGTNIFRPDVGVLEMLTKTEREKYIARNEKAIDQAKDTLLRKLLAEKEREYKKVWKDEKRAVKKEVTQRVNQSPLYKLIGFLQDGHFPDGSEAPSAPFKMSRQGVIDEYDKEALKYLPLGIVSKEGLSPSTIADMFGYANIDEMFTALMNAPDRKVKISELTDSEMFERYGNMLSDGSLEREALESMQNSDRSNQIAYEFEVINRQLNRAKINRDNFKLRARDLIAVQKITNLRPHLYYTAEIRAARDSAKYLAKKDYVNAAEAKAKQMLNHYMYRESLQAREYMEQSAKLFKKIFGPDEKVSKNRNIELVAAARALLNKFGYSKKDVVDPLTVLEMVKNDDPELYERLTLATALSGLETDVTYKDMTLDELTQLTDAVKSLWDLARDDKLIEIDGKKILKEQVLGELDKRFNEITKPKALSKYREAKTKWDGATTFLNGAKAWARLIESWTDAVDGGPNGAFTKYIFNPISDGSIAYREAKKEYSTSYRELVKNVLEGVKYAPIRADELIDKNGQHYTFNNKSELLTALLNTGNESNLRKLLLGFGWGKAIREESRMVAGKEVLGKIIGIDSRSWEAFLDRMIEEGELTKKDFDFLQKVWNLNEQMKPAAWKAHREVYGYYPASVDAKAFSNKFGTYEGGYIPLVYNPDATADVAIRKEIETMNDNIQTNFPSVGKGFTKSRDDSFAAELALDLRLILTHIDKVQKFTHIQPAVSQVNKILLNKDFQQKLSAFDNSALQEMLLPWMTRASKQAIETPMEGKFARTVGNGLRWIRKRAVQNTMFLNLANTAEQVTGLSIAKVKVPKSHLSTALLNYTKNPTQVTEMIMKKSQFMQQRVDKEMFDVTQEISELVLNPNKYEKAVAFFDKHTYIAQSITQSYVDTVVWSGGYDYALSEGMTEKEAVRYADQSIRLTQGSYSPEDTARYQGGNAFLRLFTTFSSYFNMQANLMGSEWVKTTREMGFTAEAAPKLFYTYFYGFLVPVLVSGLIRQAFSGDDIDDDDDGYLDEFMDWFFGGQARNVAPMLPYVGSVVNSAINLLDDKPYNDSINTSPVFSYLQSALSGAKVGVEMLFSDKHTSGHDIKDFTTLMSLITQLPLQQFGRTGGYLQEVDRGKAKPEGVIDFTRGAITGKSGQ